MHIQYWAWSLWHTYRKSFDKLSAWSRHCVAKENKTKQKDYKNVNIRAFHYKVVYKWDWYYHIFWTVSVIKYFFQTWEGFFQVCHVDVSCLALSCLVFIIPPPAKLRGLYWFHCPSVCPPVCLPVDQIVDHSVSSSILTCSISYLHTLSTKFKIPLFCRFSYPWLSTSYFGLLWLWDIWGFLSVSFDLWYGNISQGDCCL